MIGPRKNALALLCAAIISLGALLSCAEARAADLDEDFQIWMPIIAQVDVVPDTLKAWIELQPRLVNDAQNLGAVLYRPGLGYYPTKWLSLWGGYAFVERHWPTYLAEHRAWEQVQLADMLLPSIGLKGLARFRLEQRFFEGTEEVGNRLRMLFRVQMPIVGDAAPSLHAIVWDELFFGLHETVGFQTDGLDRNRAFAGFGFQAIKQARVELGYMLELVRRPNQRDELGNHVLAISLWIDLP